MASACVLFDEVLERCKSDVPGEVISVPSDESEEDIADHHESVRMLFMRKTTALQAILVIRTLRAIGTVRVFCLFVLAIDFTNQFLLRMLYPYFPIRST